MEIYVSWSHTVGVDLGGTTVRTGLYNDKWELLECITLPTRVLDGPHAVVEDVSNCVAHLATKYGARPIGIGLGSPGPLNIPEGRLMRLPNFPGWDGFPLRSALESATGLRVSLESDGNAAALAELKAGAGLAGEVDSLCMLTLGTGVGSGIVLKGKVWHGQGMAGELGHVCLVPDGIPCGCGGRGCLERYASATAIVARGQECFRADIGGSALDAEMIGALTTQEMARLALGGHEAMINLFDQVGYYLGLGIAAMIIALDLPLYVVGGGVANAWDLFAPAMFRSVHDHSYVYQLGLPTQTAFHEKGRTFITKARLGSQAGLLGAAFVSVDDDTR